MSPETIVQSSPRQLAAGAQKDSYFSNAKLALIVLVVVGHTWSPLVDESLSVKGFYITLYELHMPAFILISGYFSRSFTGSPRQWYRLISGLAVPYVLFSALYGVLGMWTMNTGFELNILDPYYLLWFLVALFIWRATSPLWSLVRYPLTLAVTIYFATSLMELPGVLDLGRIFQYLPFFVAGLVLRRHHFEALRRPLVRIVSAVAALAILACCIRYGDAIDTTWTYYTKGAQQLSLALPEVLLVKLALLACSIIMLVAFFAFVPDGTFSFSRLGELTMYPFLLHGFVTKGAELGLDIGDYKFPHTAWGAISFTVGGVLLAMLLLSKPIRWAAKPLVAPRLDWALKPEPPRQTEPVTASAKPAPEPEPAGTVGRKRIGHTSRTGSEAELHDQR